MQGSSTLLPCIAPLCGQEDAMKLEHFRYMLEIERLHSISAAARSLHIGQTTLNAIVKNAEEELGYPIFQRTPSGVAVTVPGERFLLLAWEINLKYEALLSLKYRFDEEPAIRLLLPPSVGSCLALTLTNEFYQYELRGNLEFEECISVMVGEQIRKGTANLGLAYLTEENIAQLRSESAGAFFQLQRLLSDRLYLIVAKPHPLSVLNEVDITSLYGERLATAKAVRSDAILGRVLENWAHVTRFTSIDLVMQAVLKQGMIGFLPRYILLSEESCYPAASQFAAIPIRNTERPNRLALCLLHRPDEMLTQQEKILKICVLNCFQRFREAHKDCSLEEDFYENGISSVSP